MPRTPKGAKRPADVVGNAVRVMQIATGEIEEPGRDPAKAHMARGGKKGGAARAKVLSKKRRSEIAKKAAKARWGRPSP